MNEELTKKIEKSIVDVRKNLDEIENVIKDEITTEDGDMLADSLNFWSSFLVPVVVVVCVLFS